MNDYGNRGGSERRPSWPGLGGMFDWEPFRSLSSINQQLGVEVSRKENGYEVEVAVPGYRPEDLDVRFQDGVLTVTGRNERRNFTRSLAIPDDVDEENIQARVEHGMLLLTLPQHPAQQPRRINITGGSSSGTQRQVGSQTAGGVSSGPTTTTGTTTPGAATSPNR